MAERKYTMSDVRRISLAKGGFYFTRDTKRFFGPERFWGPYSGPGGVFFVKHGRSGNVIQQFHPESGRIDWVANDAHPEDARDRAKALARGAGGGSRSSERGRKRKSGARRGRRA